MSLTITVIWTQVQVPDCDVPENECVKCVNGNDVKTGTSCYSACDGKCCRNGGADVCKGFTGTVVKDGSCMDGFNACDNANIDLVSETSCIGTYGGLLNPLSLITSPIICFHVLTEILLYSML